MSIVKPKPVDNIDNKYRWKGNSMNLKIRVRRTHEEFSELHGIRKYEDGSSEKALSKKPPVTITIRNILQLVGRTVAATGRGLDSFCESMNVRRPWWSTDMRVICWPFCDFSRKPNWSTFPGQLPYCVESVDVDFRAGHVQQRQRKWMDQKDVLGQNRRGKISVCARFSLLTSWTRWKNFVLGS